MFYHLFFYIFFRYKKYKRSEINLKRLEMDLHKNTEDKSLLDKNIKEFAYILINSKVNVVVFEDLYRFDNINILIKLIELNFIVNLQTKWSKIS
ncbi:hypothetical protein [Mesomycoplasma hyorhinis]|uniref:YobI family P-loop NTPase n=1 Tax=Mesomycoplasma hyorhinis TaxID=2100 RepID=UPI002FE0B034